jgi:DNA (cytosine-5)-methyltransferase 1
MKHGALFNGIGGFQLAARWMGWNNVFHCEIDDFCNKVVRFHFPNSVQYGNIKTTDFRIYRGQIDILTGGFPCQPYSTAGKRKGTEDNRHLWPEMLRAIREISPRWVVGENVRGLTNWSKGLVFDQVQADLETEGYEVLPFLLPACGVNAPHRRDRIWFIAHSASNGYREEARFNEDPGTQGENKGEENKREWFRDDINGNDAKGTITNTSSKASWASNDGGWPTQSPVFIGNDGVPAELDSISISDWIEQSNKSSGNAIVPQVAFEIFSAIHKYENLNY